MLKLWVLLHFPQMLVGPVAALVSASSHVSLGEKHGCLGLLFVFLPTALLSRERTLGHLNKEVTVNVKR